MREPPRRELGPPSSSRARGRSRPRDIRAKRPPALSFVLRWDTARRASRVVVLLLLDFVGVSLAIFTALGLKAAIEGSGSFSDVFATTRHYVSFAYLVTVLLFARSRMYASRGERPGLTRVLASLSEATLVMAIFAVVSDQQFQSYYIFYGSFAFAVVYVSSLRWACERVSGELLRAAGYRRRAVIVGTGRHIDAVARALAGGSQVTVVGYVSLEPWASAGLRSLGAFERLGRTLVKEQIDELIIADPDFPQERAVALVDEAHERGVRVRIAPSTMEILIHRADFVPGEALPLFELRAPVFDGVDFIVKRIFDLVTATLLLILLSPLLALIALAVRLSSRGPVIYRSVRIGIGGTPFTCLKFRTMRIGADAQQEALEAHNEASGALFKIRDDPRLTRVGRALRRRSLDELPQLANVLRGQMSLVGPRPLPERDFDLLEPWHMNRYLVLPGMTGLWQVSGRAELDFDDLVRLDFLYLERWSVFLDLTILLKTIPAVLLGRGAF
ncbi:MAG TPA: sugar transferase [Solirubrobacteraceae bacterium]|nr:sugar transferase [Solirubrobacteraceae bacterium]